MGSRKLQCHACRRLSHVSYCLGAITVLVSATIHHRAQYTKSPRLLDVSTPGPFLELSQGHAIVSAIPVLSGWTSRLFDKIRGTFQAESHHTRDVQVPDDPVESPYFGIASILNISFFLVLGSQFHGGSQKGC